MASTRPVLACLFALLLGIVDAPPAAALSGQQELIDKFRNGSFGVNREATAPGDALQSPVAAPVGRPGHPMRRRDRR